jgi:cation diffusion facilitator CzcD-associated flavoprotein CzcO
METKVFPGVTPRDALPGHVRVLVAGAGFAGLGMAVRLLQQGEDDLLVVERAHDVGGTWRDNHYPGAACDVPSKLYSFSFAPNPGWSHSFSRQAEIQAYLRDCAERFGVRDHLVTGCTLEEARWDAEARRWNVRTSLGELTCDVLVAAAGALSEPRNPEIPGLERFTGKTFHSAAWDHDHDLSGERVAVVGTGASAIQIVPQIQPRVGRLDLYQRTPAWIIPRRDRRFSGLERRLFARVPALQRLGRAAIYWARESHVVAFTRRPAVLRLLERVALRHLARQVPDPALRAKLTPGYRIGCKRILISNDFYPALGQENAEVVTSGIAEVRERSIVTRDGVERPTDTIVFATGFQVTPPPIAEAVQDADGRALADHWAEKGMQGHRGTTVAGFPNLFFLVGPNTGLGHSSMVYMIEAQVDYVLGALRAMREEGLAAIAPRPEAQAAFNAGLQRRMRGTIWQTGGCASWYLDQHGNNVTLWPDFTFRFRRLLERFDRHNYEVVPARVPAPVAAGMMG